MKRNSLKLIDKKGNRISEISDIMLLEFNKFKLIDSHKKLM